MSEYYPKRTSKFLFRLTKFDDTTEPVNVYIIEIPYGRKKPKCSCRKHYDCLHIKMVKEWERLLYPIGGFYFWPADDEHDEEYAFFSYPHGEGFYYTVKGGLCN